MHKSKVLEYAIVRMKHLNVRLTPQRVAVLEHLLNSKLHPTANNIYQAVEHRFPGMSLATVYNNLNFLCKNGLARELTFSNASSRYDGDTTDHYHIICSNCSKIVDFYYPSLKEIEALAEQTTDFKVSHHQLEIYGTCKTCRD